MVTQPPFDALIAFEAVQRRRSVTAAANELGMTQSAVSHRLRRLEDFMGLPLLARTPGGMRPTPAGVALAAGLSELLSSFGELRARCRAAAENSTLRVGVGAALADYWLVARLAGFIAKYPDTPIELVIIESAADATALDLNITIHWLPEAEARETSTQRVLFREHVFPVCHPRLLKQAPLDNPRRIVDFPLIHKGPGNSSSAGSEWSWTSWFTRIGLNTPPPSGLRCANIATAISAAIQCRGVVLARSLLVRDALADGRLTRVLPEAWAMPSSKVHLVRWPAALISDKRVTAFARWLSEAAFADEPST